MSVVQVILNLMSNAQFQSMFINKIFNIWQLFVISWTPVLNFGFYTVNLSIIQSQKELCQHTIQSGARVVDELGYVCSRSHLLHTGCCDQTKRTTFRFLCSSCTNINCCSVYEHCVSCCLNPINVCISILQPDFATE